MSQATMEIRTLAMVAAALSEEYGVTVKAGGREARTIYPGDGSKPIISIPALTAKEPNYLPLVRGYIDHETGHVRFTNRDEISTLHQTNPKMVKVIANIIEDVYVERVMGECFPGCKRNLTQMTRIIFKDKAETPVDPDLVRIAAQTGQMSSTEVGQHLWNAILKYALYRVRSVPNKFLEELVPQYRKPVDELVPGLAARMDPILDRVPSEGVDTTSNGRLAIELYETIMEFLKSQDGKDGIEASLDGGESSDGEGVAAGAGQGESGEPTSGSGVGSGGGDIDVDDIINDMELQAHQSDDDSGTDITKQAQDSMRDIADEEGVPSGCDMGQGSSYYRGRASLEDLSEQDIAQAMSVSAALDARLQALLQTFVLNRQGVSRTGRLDSHMLHRLAVNNPRVFRRNIEKRGIDTEVVLVVDMSGSMGDGGKAGVTSKALYAIMRSLRRISGIRSSVVGFYGDCLEDILKPSHSLTKKMRIVPRGGTLCGEALAYALGQFSTARASRKIVLMLTDGDTENRRYFREMIAAAKGSGVEFLGIGIQSNALGAYLSNDEFCKVDNLGQLAPEMFRLLQHKLLGV